MRFGKEDGQSIKAMKAARMSPESIAQTLGGRWTARKVLAAVEALEEMARAEAGLTGLTEPASEPPHVAHGVRPIDALSQQARAAGLTVLPCIPRHRMRFIRWFADAGWTLKEIAWLFDLEAEELAQALETADA